MPRTSAGLLLYRRGADGYDVLIGHPGGPFWARKDARAWSVPKGEYLEGEDPLAAARREFAEEIGTTAPAGDYVQLGTFRQPSGKIIAVFTAEAPDFQPGQIVSNTFPLEWPRGSGTIMDFPEIDDARWIGESGARTKLVRGQVPILDALIQHVAERSGGDAT